MVKNFVIFSFLFGTVFGLASSELSLDDVVATLGSAVNITIGPRDAVYCYVRDPTGELMSQGFGLCRLVIDRITKEHEGRWSIRVGGPGEVEPLYLPFEVKVLSAVVTTAVTGNDNSVMLTCSVPDGNEIHACMFSIPSHFYIASPLVGLEGNTSDVIRYDSGANSRVCWFRIFPDKLDYPQEYVGIWRCAVVTALDISYGFLPVNGSMMGQPDRNIEPYLRSRDPSFRGDEGDALTISCSISAAIRYCYFRAPNGTIFNTSPSTSSAGHEYVGEGLDAGECGMRINNLWRNDSGHWSCNVGLFDNPIEMSTSFPVSVIERMSLFHGWQGNSLRLRLLMWHNEFMHAPLLEYCRFVRIDGLGFMSDYVPYEYTLDMSEPGSCTLTIPNPTSWDLGPWMVAAKVKGRDGELSMTSSLSSSPTGDSSFMMVLVWIFISILCLLLILCAVSLVPKKNREWTYQRAASFRNSFRKQPKLTHDDDTSPCAGYR